MSVDYSAGFSGTRRHFSRPALRLAGFESFFPAIGCLRVASLTPIARLYILRILSFEEETC